MTPPTAEMKRPNGWRNIPVTVGLAVGMIAAVAAIVGFFFKTTSEVKGIAKESVKSHCIKDIDRAHIDMPHKYVPRTELYNQMHKIDRRLIRIEDTQKQILERLPRRRRHRRDNGS